MRCAVGKPKFTPGPWESKNGFFYALVEDPNPGHWSRRSGDTKVNRFMGAISSCNGAAGAGPEEVRANLNLAAKAPEMYTFIERVAEIHAGTPFGDEALALLEVCRG
jgi:hypothetical protein